MSGDLRGELIRLRARHEADGPILDTELHDDIVQHAWLSNRPWRPVSPGTEASSYRVREPRAEGASFSVVELAGDSLAGTAGLWDIDAHNRSAHIGIALRTAFRGKGLATDTVRVLCHYGFIVLGLHRIQIETVADNHPMIRAAERAGFTKEGVVRGTKVLGGFADEAVFGILVDEWTAA
jgi:RimJ/RimL family protein N-acetyltransferase